MRLATAPFFLVCVCFGAQAQDSPAPVAEPRQPSFSFQIEEFEEGLPRGAGQWAVGRVDVFVGNPAPGSPPHQTIEIVMDVDVAAFKQFGIRRPDLNCDGFRDLAVLQHGGAKWGRAHVWIYHPTSGKFVTNPLTRAFADLSFADYRIDTKNRRLHIQKLSGAQVYEHTYRIDPDGLNLESKDLVK